MNGLVLAEMDASDMLDVIHYIFEEDMAPSTGEQAEARSRVRSIIYREFYNKEYGYQASTDKNSRSYIDDPINGFEEDDRIVPFDPMQKAKPYVPATKVNPRTSNPFGGSIDGPLG